VEGLEAIDGTPIIDIKPVLSRASSRSRRDLTEPSDS
jgi:tRNA (Thr-GGU) A37 N-methylase